MSLRARDTQVGAQRQISAPYQGRYQRCYDNLNSTLNDILPGANNLADWSDGQARAAVCLQQNECRWGSWREQKAALLHFFTTRFEPQGFKLATLTTELSFHEDDPKVDKSSNLDLMSLQNVYIPEKPAPTVIVPRGLSKHEEQSCWRYSSFLKGEGQRYKTAIWYWETGTGSHRLGDLHGAVLVCCKDTPFYICCKVEGRLISTMTAGVWSIGRRIMRLVSRTAIEGQSFRFQPSPGQESFNLENSVADMHRKVEALTHGIERSEEFYHSQQLESYPECGSKRRKVLDIQRELSFRSLTRDEYSIAIICALSKELKAVRCIFDHSHNITPPMIDDTDTNKYTFGTISGHNIVATCLPQGLYGNNSAADVASQLRRSFPQLESCLLVGIGGGIPSSSHDIRLGDVVISTGGIVKYDFGKVMENGVFQPIGILQPSPRRLLKLITDLESDQKHGTEPLRPYLDSIISQEPAYRHPGLERDILFKANYQHPDIDNENGICLRCSGPKVDRPSRPSNQPKIHYGLIASGDKLIKNAQIRDQISNRYDALCFDMEGAGAASVLSCLSIRGISDYSDSHKHDEWQEYASAAAASYVKLLLTDRSRVQSPD